MVHRGGRVQATLGEILYVVTVTVHPAGAIGNRLLPSLLVLLRRPLKYLG